MRSAVGIRRLQAGEDVKYLTWMAVIAILYPLCRWFCAVKRRRHDWWLGYL
jgi:hypothetical protein